MSQKIIIGRKFERRLQEAGAQPTPEHAILQGLGAGIPGLPGYVSFSLVKNHLKAI